MSLALAAQHLASRGRGPDTMLVHMAPSEVHSLQAVAKAHGGSLTINPETGLPEAGFLSSILPMIAGVGLTALSGGTLSPLMAGLLTGGVTGVATGNLGKGLMAGLGAYGGAGLGSALAGAGATQGLTAASAEAAAAGQAEAAKQLADANMMAKYQAAGISPEQVAQSAREFGSNQITPAAQAALVKPSATSTFDNMIAGVKGLGSEAGRDAFMQNIGGAKGLFKSGAAALSPAMMAQSGEMRPPSGGSNPYDNYRFRMNPTGAGPSTSSRESKYFNPEFYRMAEGGSADSSGAETSDAKGLTSNTGLTGQSEAYYNYLMGMPTNYAPGVFSTPVSYDVATPVKASDPLSLKKSGSAGGYYDQAGPGGPTPGGATDANIGIDPTGMGGQDPAVAAAEANAAAVAASVAAEGMGSNNAHGGLIRRMADGGEATPVAAQYPDFWRFLMQLPPAQRALYQNMTPTQYAIAQHQQLVSQASRLDNQGPGAPTPAEVNEQAMANALSGVNGSLNPVAQTMSNLAQDLGLTNNPLSIALAVLGAAGGNPLALAPIAAANAAAIDPTNPSSINAQNAMDVGAHPALGFGGANNINAQIGSMGAHANPANNSGLTSGQINAINASIANTANIDPTGMGGIDPGIAAAMAADANIGIDPSGMGGIDPGVAAADAAAAASAAAAAADGQYARGGLSSLAAFAQGGYNLGDYSDGGRLLRGPGDGVSDSIPASIADKRPARLADGEFVVPARIVSELGNGSTDAGARRLYAMMDRIQQNRGKTTGKGKVAVNSRSEKYLPA